MPSIDIPQEILDLLETNWNSANTDGNTAEFLKITDFKTHNFNDNRDLVCTHRPIIVQKPAGLGTGAKQVEYVVNVDIRCQGMEDESHFLNVKEEVLRILDNNLTYPFTGVDELSPDNSTMQDLSDKNIGRWRILIPVKTIAYNEAR